MNDKALFAAAVLVAGLFIGDCFIGKHGQQPQQVDKTVSTPHFLREMLAVCVERQMRMRLPADICYVSGYAHVHGPVWF